MDRGINYHPTEKERETVRALVAFGHGHRAIAEYMDMQAVTLRKHFRNEIDKGRTDLELICGGYLIDCVKDPAIEPKYRIDCAKFFLSRKCDWHDRPADDAADDKAAITIREGVKALKEAFGKPTVDKEVDANDAAPG